MKNKTVNTAAAASTPTFIIEDIPVVGVSRNKYGWERLNIGQSIVADKTAVGASYAYGRKHGVKFASTKLENGLVRVGRIA